MKTKLMYVTVLVALMSMSSVFAQSKTEQFKVYGNCSMCEKRIEKAAKSVEGVSAADWSHESQMMEISFDSTKTDVHQVHMAIANVGHDTEMHKAKNEVYSKLPGCCKYTRDSEKKGGHCGHKH